MKTRENNERIMRRLREVQSEPICNDRERRLQLLCRIPLSFFVSDDKKAITYTEGVRFWSYDASVTIVSRNTRTLKLYVTDTPTNLLRLIDRTYHLRCIELMDAELQDNDSELNIL